MTSFSAGHIIWGRGEKMIKRYRDRETHREKGRGKETD